MTEPRATTAAPTATPTVARWYLNAPFARVWSILTLTSVAEFLLESAAAVWAVDVFGAGSPQAALTVGLLVLVSTGPRLVFAPLAGVMTDRSSYRRVLVLANLGRTAVLAAAAVVAATAGAGAGYASVLLLTLAVLSCLQQYLPPARAAAVQAVVPEADRPRASSLTMIALTVVAVAAGGLGPVLYIRLGLPVLLVIALVAFAAAAGLALGLPVTPKNPQPRRLGVRAFWSDVVDGWRTCWQHAELRTLLLGVAVYGVALGVNGTALPLFVMGTLGLEAHWFGLVTAAFAAGNLVGALVTPRAIAAWTDLTVFRSGLVLLGAGYVAFALAPNGVVAVAAMGLCGALFAAFSVAQGPIMQRAAPPGMIGRVATTTGPLMALVSLAGTGAASLAFAVVNRGAGGASAAEGPQVYRVAILAAAVALIIGGVLVSQASRSVPRPGTRVG